MFVAKQDLKSVPFQMLHEKLVLVKRKVKEEVELVERASYDRLIARKEKEWNDTHEAPFEGNFSEEFPYTGPSLDYINEVSKKAVAEAFDEIAVKLSLKTKASWLLPQLTAYIGKKHLYFTNDGFVDIRKTVTEAFLEDDWGKGVLDFCTAPKRGTIVPDQYTPIYKNYSAVVPLIPMAFKKFQNVPYEKWRTKNLHTVVDSSLYDAMTYEGTHSYSKEEMLRIRDNGLLVKSATSKKAGTMRVAERSHVLYGVKEPEFHNIPWLVSVMWFQIWMCHPSSRSDLMILDPSNWDSMPEALIDTEVQKPNQTSTKRVIAEEIQWD